MATVLWDTPKGEQERELAEATSIGRSPQCDIWIPDNAMSGAHASIVREGNDWLVQDDGSTNGTFVNEERVSRRALRDGDVIRVGRTELCFCADEAPAPAEQPTGATRLSGQSIVWRRGEAEAGAAADRAPALDQVIRGDVEYSPVTSVNTTLAANSAMTRTGTDAAELGRRLKAIYEISRATAATLDTSEILDHVLGALFEIFETADRAFIILVDPQSNEVNTAAARSRVADRVAQSGISRTALERAMSQREAVLCQDASVDARFSDAVSIMGLGIRSMMIAPLVFRDEVLGAVHIDTVKGVRTFTEADLELLCVAASEVAGCLANVRLHDKMMASERLAAVGQTLAGLTHCIKNILQGVKGGAYILEKGLEQDNPDRIRSGWQMVRRNNAFMEELVYDLLTYSKQRPPEYVPTDLNALCADTCGFVAERARTLGVSLTCTPDPSLGQVELDPRGIRRCLLNFVGNAVDACANTNGSATVEVRGPASSPEADGLVRVSVRDTGCGMSKETLAKLFTVFFSTKGSKGTGLGLPVSQKIVEEHGGRIDVESQEGKGTTFTLCLPARRRDTKTL